MTPLTTPVVDPARQASPEPEVFAGYELGAAYDEMFAAPEGPRAHYAALHARLATTSPDDFRQRKAMTDLSMREDGVGFTVYRAEEGIERVWPMDPVPRIIPAAEWRRIEEGLVQRITALNLFLWDVYHEQRILRDGVVPARLVLQGGFFRREFVGVDVPRRIYVHICGTDLIRAADGTYLVLEDNARTPSGVSYMLQNRQVLKRVFPSLFNDYDVLPNDDYPAALLDVLQWIAPPTAAQPVVVLLSPGIYNSAYFEHSFLARQMGVELVQGSDLVVQGDVVFMRTTHGLDRVDVIYRRIDDDFLDPLAFREDSLVGVPGLMRAYRAGNVALVNAPGTGIADDKAVYAYVPQIIRYYLGEDAIIPNVPTFVCGEPTQCDHVLSKLHEFVVKPANESGGYGIVLGPRATQEQLEDCRARIKANPRNYIAQPMLSLSRVPTVVGDSLEGRHVDLRPFILYGEEIFVLPGGLTRVALVKGSLVVNSSQGGGSKDTWVVNEGRR